MSWREADNIEQAIDELGLEIDRVVDAEGHEPPNVLVAAPSREVRDRLREALALVSWDDGEPAAIVCETIHRVKGLEFDYVILVVPSNDVADSLLYVGISRAVIGLTVIGPRAIATRLGLAV